MTDNHQGRLILVTGGAASGKSALAEAVCCRIGGGLLYIAAMRPFGREAESRIARHREMRKDKGFETVERYRDLDGLPLRRRYGAALLEDTGNLAANEMFEAGRTPEEAAGAMLRGVRNLTARAGALVVVANEIFAGCERFAGDSEMAGYLRCLGEVHRRIAEEADVVVESVCGLPFVWKGELEL